MTMFATAPATVEEIVDGLKDHVWTLLRAGQLNAAMVLLADSIEDYLRIVAEVDASVSVDVVESVEPNPTVIEIEEGTVDVEPEPEPIDVEPLEIVPVDVAVPDEEDATTWSIPMQVVPVAGTATKLKIRKYR